MTIADWHDVLILSIKSLCAIAVALVASPVWAPMTSKFALGLIERWSAKKKEHIELSVQRSAEEFDRRILSLEKLTSDYSAKLALNDISNKKLAAELVETKAQISKTTECLGLINVDLKKSIDAVSISIVERLEKDEGTLLVHDSAIKGILGKIVLKT